MCIDFVRFDSARRGYVIAHAHPTLLHIANPFAILPVTPSRPRRAPTAYLTTSF